MEILQKIDEGGYPTEYLLSRIRGRRVSLVTDWEPLIFGAAPREQPSSLSQRWAMDDISSEGVWKHLQREFRWVYLQMNSTLKKIFRPFFIYTELRTLFFCFRYKTEKDTPKIEKILSQSLLSKQCKETLRKSEDMRGCIKEMEDLFLALSPKFKGMQEIFAKKGLRGIEQHLTERYLEHVIQSDIHPVMGDFFSRIIDARNIITLYKNLRWELKNRPDFIRGGTIGHEKMNRIWEKGDLFEVLVLIRSFTGIEVQNPDATGVENSLYKAMTRYLKREGREPSGIGLILDYLWRCTIEARNLGILFHGKELDRNIVQSEIIR
jgi:vacuolar-type H+-ATPase subunit C/Vma6